jgi:6-phosphogluconolactonase/glucosamine-6-phosphate isomerase/deaminase
MQKVRTVTIDNIEQPARDIAEYIRERLAEGQSVLWLVSGGSSIAVAVRARTLMHDLGALKGRLSVGLIDERYGPVGHADSNWRQLLDKGFDTHKLDAYPVLTKDTSTMEITEAYEHTLRQLVEAADIRIALLGVGTDGHTGGLLPHNPLIHESDALAGYYQAADFTRITVTPALFPKLDIGFVYAVGREKWPALRSLQEEGPIDDIPSRLITRVGKATIYTDMQGETS